MTIAIQFISRAPATVAEKQPKMTTTTCYQKTMTVLDKTSQAPVGDPTNSREIATDGNTSAANLQPKRW